jgi:hypothetical protein
MIHTSQESITVNRLLGVLLGILWLVRHNALKIYEGVEVQIQVFLTSGAGELSIQRHGLWECIGMNVDVVGNKEIPVPAGNRSQIPRSFIP